MRIELSHKGKMQQLLLKQEEGNESKQAAAAAQAQAGGLNLLVLGYTCNATIHESGNVMKLLAQFDFVSAPSFVP